MFNCMKKQFFSKLLIAAALVTAVGSFQSCKNYDDDINALEANVASLQKQDAELKAALESAKSELNAAIAKANESIDATKAIATAAQNTANDANALATSVKAMVEDLAKVAAKQAEVDQIQAALAKLQTALDGKADKAALEALAADVNAISTKLNHLTDGLASDATVKAGDDAVKAYADEAIASLKNDLQGQIDVINAFKASFDEQIEAIKQLIGDPELIATLGNTVASLAEKIAEAENNIKALQTKVSEIDVNKASISELRTQIYGLQGTINNVVSSVDKVTQNINVLNVFVDNALTSIVLRPTMYYGGIEAIQAIHAEYQPLGFSIWYQKDYEWVNGEFHALDPYQVNNGNMTGGLNYAYDRTTGNGYEITYEYNAKDDLIYKYPLMDAYYHVNPQSANMDQVKLALNTADKHYVDAFNTTTVDELLALLAGTKAEKTSHSFGLDLYGSDVFRMENGGILHTWLNNSADIWHRLEQYDNLVTVVSLEATAPANDGVTTRTITSDWAAVARVHQYNFCIADNDASIMHYSTYPHINYPQDTDCGVMDCQQYEWTEEHSYTQEGVTDATKYNKDIVHVYRQANQAILNDYTHTLKWDGSVDLDKVIEVHALHHYYHAFSEDYDFPVDIEKLGFKRQYTIVNYKYPTNNGVIDWYFGNTDFININSTEESQHAHIAADGHTLKANFVTGGKRDITKTSRSSIGREPLVMIEIIDTLDNMTWDPDHRTWVNNGDGTWGIDSVNHNPRHNLVAVGFIKFKIVDEQAPQVLPTLQLENNAMYASCAGDTVYTNWYEVEEQILDQIKQHGLSISKDEFEKNYQFRGQEGPVVEVQDMSIRELISWAWKNKDNGVLNGQVFVPQTNKTQIIGTRRNWVAGVDYNNPANWVLPDIVLNHDATEEGFVDRRRYGRIVYTAYDWMHRETNLIGVAFTATEMLQQLVKRDHRGHYLDSLGNKVERLSDADFYPYVDTKVAAKLIDEGHNGWPEITIIFNLRVYLNKATMSRPVYTGTGGGDWYNDGLTGEPKYIHANIDPYQNGGIYSHDVRRFVANLQKALDGQRWDSNTDRQRAFTFDHLLTPGITGSKAQERADIEAAKLRSLHGDLYFFTNNWLGDIEEGTPYWHDNKRARTSSVLDDKFYADRYLLKVCYTRNPLDTVVWAQEAWLAHKGKLGKYLYAYKWIEEYQAMDPDLDGSDLAYNAWHWDMNNGQLIAWIDNIDDLQFEQGVSTAPNLDAWGRINENVNVHYNWNSTFARDMLNRAGAFTEGGETQKGWEKATYNEIALNVHLNLFEGDCTTEGTQAINPLDSEMNPAWLEDYDYFWRPDGIAPTWYTHRPKGVPVMLSNPDFKVRFERPLNVEMITPHQNSYQAAVQDAVAGTITATIKYADLFRNQTGTRKIYPQDWRGYTVLSSKPDWVGFYQGVNDGTDNIWNTTPWYQSQEIDRSDYQSVWFKPVAVPQDNNTKWTADNVVPNVLHMLTNYDGYEGFLADRLSLLPLTITHNLNANGNIESTTFQLLNDGLNKGGFFIDVPVTVKYAWGDITTTGNWKQTVNLPHTSTNYWHQDNMLKIRVYFNATVGNY